MMSMRTSLTAALLSVMAAGLATGCSTPAPKVVETFCQYARLGEPGEGGRGTWRFLLFDDGSIEVLRDPSDGDPVPC